MQFPVTISIMPSRRLRAALVFVHLLAGASVFAALPLVFAAIASAGLLVSLWQAWRLQIPLVLTLGKDASLTCRLRPDDEGLLFEVLPGSTVFGWLLVLRLRGEGYRRTLIVLSDGTTPMEFRRLQIWMRWVLPFRRAAGAG